MVAIAVDESLPNNPHRCAYHELHAVVEQPGVVVPSPRRVSRIDAGCNGTRVRFNSHCPADRPLDESVSQIAVVIVENILYGFVVVIIIVVYAVLQDWRLCHDAARTTIVGQSLYVARLAQYILVILTRSIAWQEPSSTWSLRPLYYNLLAGRVCCVFTGMDSERLR